MSTPMGLPQAKEREQGNRGQPRADGVQKAGPGEADVRERPGTPVQTPDRAGGRLRADEIQHVIQTVPPLRQRQGHHGLCLLRHCLQHQENGRKNKKTA